MKDSIYYGNYNTKKLKGISKAVVMNNIQNDDYKEVLETNIPINRDVVSIRSFQHQLYTYKQNKVALTAKVELFSEETGTFTWKISSKLVSNNRRRKGEDA